MAVGLINTVGTLTGFSYKNVRVFCQDKNGGCNNEETALMR